MGSDERTWCGRDSAGLGGCLGFGYVEGVCVVGAEGGAPEDGDKARPAEAEQAMSGGQRCIGYIKHFLLEGTDTVWKEDIGKDVFIWKTPPWTPEKWSRCLFSLFPWAGLR